jgi:N-acetylglucosamine-6-phosphate deacetylase
MNRVGIMINFHEYNALRAYTHREKRMIEAYYKSRIQHHSGYLTQA